MMSQVRRRQFLIALGAVGLSVSLPALAQSERRTRRIGFYTLGSAQSSASYLPAFRQGMAELRWVEGRDYVIDARYANGVVQAAPGLVAELLATTPDLLLTPADESARLLAQKTKTIPIVFAIAQDAVGNGLAASLQRPGGNTTGLTTLARDLSAKRLQLLKEAFPRVSHVVLLIDPNDIGSLSQVKETKQAAALLGMRITPIELKQPADIEPAFKRGAAIGAHAYMVAQGYFTSFQRQAIVDRVLRSKIPAIFESILHVEAGGLMSYAPSWQDNFRRAAAYADKILKGAKPGELPVEQPIKFELVLNLKTAKAMGLRFPQSILMRADRVIE
jgi:putative tryptophan/tyrosine transport system substrate-binding protein